MGSAKAAAVETGPRPPFSLARRRSADASAPIASVLLEEGEVVGDADQRPTVTGERDDGAVPKHGVDGAALVAELAQVAAAEHKPIKAA
jgi:hypothetical protein